jgi:hypothetical protein
VVEGLTAGFGGFKGDGQLFLGFGLADELAQPSRAQFELKALFFVGARGAYEAFWSVVAGNCHAGSSLAGVAYEGKTRFRAEGLPDRAELDSMRFFSFAN